MAHTQAHDNTDHTTNYQIEDAGLTSLAALGYVSDSMIKITAEDTYEVRTMAEVLSDIGAAASVHTHDGDTLQLDAVNSDGGAFNFTTSGLVTFSQNIASANYGATNKLTACATNAGTLDFSAASKTLTVEDNAIVSQDYSTDGTPQFGTLGIHTASPDPTNGLLSIYNSGINTTISYAGIYNHHVKTLGATDVDDQVWGIATRFDYNQSGGVIGHSHGIRNEFKHMAGDIGDDSNARNIYLNYSFANLDGGKVWGVVRGLEAKIEQAVGHEIVGDVFGNYLWVGCNGTVSGTTYGVYLYEVAGVDYGFYQNGTAMNVLGGPLMANLKSGTDQANAGAAAGELYVDTDDGNAVKMGV